MLREPAQNAGLSHGHRKIDLESALVADEIQLAASAEIDLALDDPRGDMIQEATHRQLRTRTLVIAQFEVASSKYKPTSLSAADAYSSAA
jgi:hypothetical protein